MKNAINKQGFLEKVEMTHVTPCILYTSNFLTLVLISLLMNV